VTNPIAKPDCSIDLYFDAGRAAAVLADVAQLAPDPAACRTDLILPDGSRVELPFTSWLGDRQTVTLTPASRVRLDAFLTFPPDDESPGPGARAPRPVYVRLWVYMGRRYIGLVFFPPNPHTGRLLVESPSIHRTLSRLLERHDGILGILHDIDHEVAYLLPNLRSRIDAPDVYDYYDANHGLDVDPLLDFFRAQVPRPTLPPTTAPAPQPPAAPDAASAGDLESILTAWREPLPPRYHRTFEEKPFDACDFCGAPLLQPPARYTVIKVFADGELRQELAICDACADSLEEGYSDESRRATAQLLAGIPATHRLRIASGGGPDRAERLTRTCLLCGAPRDAAPAYAEYATCQGADILYHVYPIVICEPCILRINDALSEKTRENWRRFYDDHFGFPPSGVPAAEREYQFLCLW
jgi:hypothetical protein